MNHYSQLHFSIDTFLRLFVDSQDHLKIFDGLDVSDVKMADKSEGPS